MADSAFYGAPSLNHQSNTGYSQGQYFNFHHQQATQYSVLPSHGLPTPRSASLDQSTSTRTQVHSQYDSRSNPSRLRLDILGMNGNEYAGLGTPHTHDGTFPQSSTASSEPSGSADSPPPWDSTSSSSYHFTEPQMPGNQESGGLGRTKQERKDIEARCRRKVRSALEDLKHALINLGLPPSQASSKAKFYGHAINFVSNLKRERDTLLEQNRLLQEENQKMQRAIQEMNFSRAAPPMPSSYTVPSHQHPHSHQRYV